MGPSFLPWLFPTWQMALAEGDDLTLTFITVIEGGDKGRNMNRCGSTEISSESHCRCECMKGLGNMVQTLVYKSCEGKPHHESECQTHDKH